MNIIGRICVQLIFYFLNLTVSFFCLIGIMSPTMPNLRKTQNIHDCFRAKSYEREFCHSLKGDYYTLKSGVQKGRDPIKVTLEGMTKFAFVGFSTEAVMNILSLADVDEKCSKWFGTVGDIIPIRQKNETVKFRK